MSRAMVLSKIPTIPAMIFQRTILPFTSQYQALTECVAPPPIALSWLSPTVPIPTILSTCTIWLPMRRGNACCISTPVVMGALSMWRTRMCVYSSGSRMILVETRAGSGGMKSKLVTVVGNFGCSVIVGGWMYLETEEVRVEGTLFKKHWHSRCHHQMPQ